MYQLEKKNYGCKVTIAQQFKLKEARAYIEELKEIIPQLPEKFGIILDLRDLSPLEKESKKILKYSQKLIGKKLQRSAVIIDSAIISIQLKRLARQSGIFRAMRFLDATKLSGYKEIARNWVINGIEP